MGEHAFWLFAIRRLDEQHGVEPAYVGMSLEDVAASYAIERRESHGSLAIARQNEVDALRAKATAAVVQQKVCRYRLTSASWHTGDGGSTQSIATREETGQ